jgi:hypothetical protein
MEMNKILHMTVLLLLVACSSVPSESAVQTAIAETQAALPTNTPTVTNTPTEAPTETPSPTPTKFPTATSQPCSVLSREFVKEAVDIATKWAEKYIKATDEGATGIIEVYSEMVGLQGDANDLRPPFCANHLKEYLVTSIENGNEYVSWVIYQFPTIDHQKALEDSLSNYALFLDEANKLIENQPPYNK